jgi:hypothetical protein
MSQKSQLSNEELTPADINLLTFFEQEYLLTRLVPTMEACIEHGFITESQYKEAFKKAKFRQELDARGIMLRGLTVPKNSGDVDLLPNGILTELQLAVANCLLDLTDNRSRKKKLQDFSVSTQTYEAWLRDPAFQHYLRQRTENALGDNIHEAHLALVDRVRGGDVPALKLYYEITGRHAPSKSDNVDVGFVLTRVTEIILKHVRDPEIQAAVGEELVALATGIGLAKAAKPHLELAPVAIGSGGGL